MDPLTDDAIEAMKVAELKEHLKKRSLPQSGVKAQLAARLKEAIHASRTTDGSEDREAVQSPAASEPEPADEPPAAAAPEAKPASPAAGTQKAGGGGGGGGGGRISRGSEAADAAGARRKRGWGSAGVEDKDAVAVSSDIFADIMADDGSATGAAAAPVAAAAAAVDIEGCSLRVDGFVRPFRKEQAKELLEQAAGCAVTKFWMDVIKTHCFATFETDAGAAAAARAVQGLQWPQGSSARLSVRSVTDREVDEAGTAPPPAKRPRPAEAVRAPVAAAAAAPEEPPTRELDTLFKKTKTRPSLYWQPLTEEEAKAHAEAKAKGPVSLRAHISARLGVRDELEPPAPAPLPPGRGAPEAAAADRDRGGPIEGRRGGDRDRWPARGERDRDWGGRGGGGWGGGGDPRRFLDRGGGDPGGLPVRRRGRSRSQSRSRSRSRSRSPREGGFARARGRMRMDDEEERAPAPRRREPVEGAPDERWERGAVLVETPAPAPQDVIARERYRPPPARG